MSDIDRHIAIKVMGWKVFEITGMFAESGELWCDDNNGRLFAMSSWSPSNRIDHAWQVVERVGEWYIDNEISRIDDGTWYVGFGQRRIGEEWGWFGYGEDYTAPLAICKAALRAAVLQHK